jgi:hypothetical protein
VSSQEQTQNLMRTKEDTMYSHLTPLVAAARTADDLRRAAIVGHIAGTVLAPDDAGRRTSRVRLAGRTGCVGDLGEVGKVGKVGNVDRVGCVGDVSARRPARA